MNTQKHKWILYLITVTILVTICIQFYWNYKNYQQNKQRVTNEIQLSLDNAVEEYYSSLAKSDFLTIVDFKSNKENEKSFKTSKIGDILNKINSSKELKPKITLHNIKITSDESLSTKQIDSMMNSTKEFVVEFNKDIDSIDKKESDSTKIISEYKIGKNSHFSLNKNRNKADIKYFKGKKAADSLRFLTNLKPIFISFLDESVEYKKIESLIENQLKQKGIDLQTSFHHLKNDTLFYETKDVFFDVTVFSVNSKSTFVRDNEVFHIFYTNPNLEVLKRSSLGILLSLLLSLTVISLLFYLLKIINQQKELATVKNDLISNITHEFKTPIATVSTAIEAIENFNIIDDKEKTKKYLSISSFQLKKLHQMVEKLLETAALESENLILKKEETELVELTEKLANKHQLIHPKKTIHFSSNAETFRIDIDSFHFENAVSNLIDNAVKYGGNHIQVAITRVLNTIEISVADNGNGIEKHQQEKIFDKFYRVPKGNTHDIKGFGIGLYYSKIIIIKHKGILQLLSNTKNTIFKITLPYE